MGKITHGVAVVAVLLALPVPAWAGQAPAAAKAGEAVIVTQSSSGQELQGRLLELSSSSMAMLVNGQRVELPIEQVLRIDIRGDSLKNGAIIGGAVMAGLSGLACGIPEVKAAECVAAVAYNTGFGALLGAGIDALHKGRTPIYIKAGKAESSLQVRLRF